MKGIIAQDIITATEFRDSIFQISSVNLHFTKQVEKFDWLKMQKIVRAMHKNSRTKMI